MMTTPLAPLVKAVEKTTMEQTVLSAAVLAKSSNPALFLKALNTKAFVTERKRQFFE